MTSFALPTRTKGGSLGGTSRLLGALDRPGPGVMDLVGFFFLLLCVPEGGLSDRVPLGVIERLLCFFGVSLLPSCTRAVVTAQK